MGKILDKLENIERNILLMSKNVLSIEDVELLTGLSRRYLYKLTSRNEIPHSKPNGKKMYFDRKEIEDWMRQNRVCPKQEIEQKAVSYLITGKKKGGEI